MKTGKVLFYSAVVALSLFCIGAVHQLRQLDQPVTYNHKPTVQERYTHEVSFLDETTHGPVGFCTATAIGPHALLTAKHCNEDGPEPSRHIMLDLSTHVYHILTYVSDGRDHVIYLLDGPEFKSVMPYATRKPRLGEKVFIVGCGKDDFPCTVKSGRVLDEYDPSDIDKEDGVFYFSIPVVHGDSGSIVYAEDGTVLGVVTYLVVNGEGCGFELDFTQENVRIAQTFNLLDYILGGLSNGNNSRGTPDAPTGLVGNSR